MLVKAKHELAGVSNHQRYDNYHRPTADTCPPLTDEEKMLSATANCPWEMGSNYDAYRYPKSMSYAKCKCIDCRRNPRSSCEIIWYNTVVLRHNGTCIDGLYVYEPYLEPVPVGCACTPRVMVPVSTRRHRSPRHIWQFSS